MANDTLPLPVDIPWKRLCVSEDMIDREVCDKKFPNRWRSSVAIFSYEPPEEHQTYDGMTVSYLKVACTITGYQSTEELGISNKAAYTNWLDDTVHEEVIKTSTYYGCYGAILEVSLKPRGDAADDLTQYPYFINFEPKKRELYELVTDTGEAMSRSLDEVNVQKGTTTTVGGEVLDPDKRTDLSALGGQVGSVAGGTVGGPGGAAVGGGLGTVVGGLFSSGGDNQVKNINQSQRTNLYTSDHSREMRELHSHTTQLSQMYQQFTSYHLGTNRAVFFMLPRPHIVQTDQTFVQGPRLLEGIQEVFLVVMRPQNVKQFAVEAYLETAHLEELESQREEYRDYSLGNKIKYNASNSVDLSFLHERDKMVPETFLAPSGWQIDTSRGNGGFEIVEQQLSHDTFESASDSKFNGTPVPNMISVEVNGGKTFATIKAEVGYYYWKLAYGGSKAWGYVATLKFRVKFYLRRLYPSTLFLTGRGVCCPKRPEEVEKSKSDSVNAEIPLMKAYYYPEANNSEGMSIREANRLRSEIGHLLVQSVNRSDRYPRGTLDFADAQFISRRIAELIDRPNHPDNHPVQDIAGLKPEVRDKIVAAMPLLRRAGLLHMKLQETMDRFELTHEEAIHLRRAALGLEGPPLDPKERWDPPSRRIEHEVPNVVGFSLAEATDMLQAEDLLASAVTYQDSEQPTGTVLNQHPDGDETVRGGTEIHLVVATGLTVRIPDVVGRPLTEALCMLREAGLQAEPELEFLESREQPQHTVLDITPAPRTYVTPNSQVVLQVSQ